SPSRWGPALDSACARPLELLACEHPGNRELGRRRSETLPAHATTVCRLVERVRCSLGAHSVDLRIGRLDGLATAIREGQRLGVGAQVIGAGAVVRGG